MFTFSVAKSTARVQHVTGTSEERVFSKVKNKSMFFKYFVTDNNCLMNWVTLFITLYLLVATIK